MLKSIIVAGLGFGALAANASETQPAPDAPVNLTMELNPSKAADGHADGVDVRYVLTPATPGERPVLRWDRLSSTPGRSSDNVERLQVSDARGPIAMTSTPEPTERYDLFTDDRSAEGPITVSYHVPVALPINPRGRGPHRELQAAGGGVSTSGDGICRNCLSERHSHSGGGSIRPTEA